ncbi:hypothetical protein EVAR_3536_1 [Eumeta japonica]|uniref:Uncharacterized protein n=1 Tax=Eumeta variegata TaxID=151549 RepID=A0A4C1SYB4_EUMVA|nr:hypothetical protein EVAR_3536_1 [Eumeta japonica]
MECDVTTEDGSWVFGPSTSAQSGLGASIPTAVIDAITASGADDLSAVRGKKRVIKGKPYTYSYILQRPGSKDTVAIKFRLLTVPVSPTM